MLRYSRAPEAPEAGAAPVWTHRWYWRARLPARKGQKCRVLAWGRMNTILVEFPDGEKVTTSRHAIRRIRGPEKKFLTP